MLDNRAGAMLTVGPTAARVKTDARVLYLHNDGTREPDKGQLAYGVAYGATHVDVAGKSVHRSKTRATVEWPK